MMILRLFRSIIRVGFFSIFRHIIAIFPPVFIWKLARRSLFLSRLFFAGTVKELNNIADFCSLEKKDNAAKAIIEHFLNETDTFYFSRPEKLCKIVSFVNRPEPVKGKAFLFFISHFGPNASIIPALSKDLHYAQIGLSPTDLIKENQITEKSQIKALMIREKLFDKTGAEFLSQQTGLRKALKALRSGTNVGIAADGRAGKSFIKTRFFARDALFSSGPFKLAYISKALIIPLFPIRENNGIKVVFENPLNSDLMDAEKDTFIITALSRYINLLERYIIKYPHFYLYYLYLCKTYTYNKTNSMFPDSLTKI